MVNVLVIGAGRRVKGAVLPALHCLGDRFRVAGVVARSARAIEVGGRELHTVASVGDVDLAAIDLVYLAVSIKHVPKVLADLAARPVGHAVLMIDTPVLPPSGLGASRHFAVFRRVLVAEDNLALPPFLLARRLIDEGAIGRLTRIYFFHSGFKHHALASLKLLSGGQPIRRIVNHKFAGKLRQKEIELGGGVSAVMYEPRDYATGKLLLVGDRGAIADYDYAARPTRRIGYQLDGPIYRGLTLDGEPVQPAGLDRAYLDRVGTDVFDGTPMNTMKLRGLMDLLDAALEPSSPYHYAAEDGIADHMAIRVVDRVGFALAPHRVRHLLPLVQRLGRR